jgi:hypothetical protein
VVGFMARSISGGGAGWQGDKGTASRVPVIPDLIWKTREGSVARHHQAALFHQFPVSPLPMTADFPNSPSHPAAGTALNRFPETRCLAGKPSPRDQDAPMTRMDETVLQTPYYLDRQVQAARQHGEDREAARALRRESAAGAQMLCHLGRVRFHARLHGRHHVFVAQRGAPRPHPFRQGDPRLFGGLCRSRDRRGGLPRRQDHLQFDRPADPLREPVAGIIRGLRLNPGVSSSTFDLADPARPFSRLGEWDLPRSSR